MVTALVVVFVVLLVAAIVYLEAGDIIVEKFHLKRPAREMELPFLIMPMSPSDAPMGRPATRWGPAPTYGGRTALAEERETDADDFEEPDSATIVFRRPLEEPMQLLPGRLKVIAGEDGRDEIRFMGSIGQRAEIIVGREVGPPQRFITLRSATVSRRHARMDFVDGQWRITNLSKTNPVMVNDEMLSAGRNTTRPLADGDQIELGEVIMRFSAR